MRFPTLIILVAQALTSYTVAGQNQLMECLQNNEDASDCLVIGGLSINSDRELFNTALGKPDDIQLSGDTTIIMYKMPRAYRVRNPKSKYLKRPYILVEELNHTTRSIQLNGYNTKLNLDFYGISLGTATEKVTELFGTAKEVWPWKQLKADIWYFENPSYVFIVQDHKVVGIRLLRK